ncbi:MAG: GAF domain-containing protein [Bacteroidota bacterium]|nr:GAF domain-containing protein [Bacteroidota bacterium]
MAEKRTSNALATRLFTVVIVFLFISFLLGFYVASTIVRISIFSQLNSQLDRVLIEAGKSTIEIKEFLLNAYTDEEFVSKGTNQNFKEFQIAIDTAGTIISKLSKVEILIDNDEERKSIIGLESSLLSYKQNLQEISDLFRRKGFKDLGLEGEMRTAIHFIENYPISINKVLLLTLRRHEKDFLLRKDVKYIEKFNTDISKFKSEIQADYRYNNIQKAELIGALDNYDKLFKEIVDIETRIGLTPKDGIRHSITQNYHNFKLHLNQLGDEVKSEQLALKERVNVVLVIMGLLFVIILVAAILSLRYYIRQISVPLQKLNEYSDSIAKGNLSIDMTKLKSSQLIKDVVDSFEKLILKLRLTINQIEDISSRKITNKLNLNSENDEIGLSLNKIIEQITEYDLAEQKRKWSNEGLTIFSEIIRKSETKTSLCDAIVTQSVKYLNANQAGLFLIDQTNKCINLTSAYAYNRKKYLKRTLELNEGLIGQCYLEKDKIFITDIPDSYLTITSGLGHANPKCILIVPFINQEEVKAVLEIAAFEVFEDHQIEFIEKIGEMVASAIASTEMTEKTIILLNESKEKEQLLRNQEEEIRQNLEEMMATHEELERTIKSKDEEMRILKTTVSQISEVKEIANEAMKYESKNKKKRYGRRIEFFLDN